jgi:hypothetical protein
VSSPAVPWPRLLTVEILQLPALRFCLHGLLRGTQLSADNRQLIRSPAIVFQDNSSAPIT